MKAWALRELRESAGRYAASVAVVAVVSAFAVLLIETISVFGAAMHRAGLHSGSAEVALGSVGAVFLGIAVIVATIVIGNTFSMIAAGRMRDIATLRLLGATSRQVRRASRIDGLAVGAAGAVAGIALGILLGFVGLALLGAVVHAAVPFEWNVQLVALPAGTALVSAVAAAASGVREVAAISPAEAARSLPAGRRPDPRARRSRAVVGTVLLAIGVPLLALGAVAGFRTPAGVLVAFVGGAVSMAGVIAAAPLILPPLVAVIALVLPGSAASKLAVANLRLEAQRTARTVLAVLVGVTVLTMFETAGRMTVQAFVHIAGSAAQVPEVVGFINGVLVAVDVLTSFSVIVAAIGLGSTLAISVVQRRRELGVLRALGFSTAQARRMLLVEGLLVAAAGTVGGLLLGVAFGWVGAVSVFGRHAFGPPLVSPLFLLFVVSGALVFGAVAAVSPGRRASRVPPAVALLEA